MAFEIGITMQKHKQRTVWACQRQNRLWWGRRRGRGCGISYLSVNACTNSARRRVSRGLDRPIRLKGRAFLFYFSVVLLFWLFWMVFRGFFHGFDLHFPLFGIFIFVVFHFSVFLFLFFCSSKINLFFLNFFPHKCSYYKTVHIKIILPPIHISIIMD
jgi:hypothetical protein